MLIRSLDNFESLKVGFTGNVEKGKEVKVKRGREGFEDHWHFYFTGPPPDLRGLPVEQMSANCHHTWVPQGSPQVVPSATAKLYLHHVQYIVYLQDIGLEHPAYIIKKLNQPYREKQKIEPGSHTLSMVVHLIS